MPKPRQIPNTPARTIPKRPAMSLSSAMKANREELTEFQEKMLTRVANKLEWNNFKRGSMGAIVPLAFDIPNFPTNLVWALHLGKGDFRFYSSEELAKGGRMLRDLPTPPDQKDYSNG